MSRWARRWRGRPLLATWDGVTQEVRQRYFVVRAPRFEIDTSGFEEFEKATVTGHRWWTVDELAATTDLMRPAGLAQLLAQLLAAGPPGEPIIVDGAVLDHPAASRPSAKRGWHGRRTGVRQLHDLESEG